MSKVREKVNLKNNKVGFVFLEGSLGSFGAKEYFGHLHIVPKKSVVTFSFALFEIYDNFDCLSFSFLYHNYVSIFELIHLLRK